MEDSIRAREELGQVLVITWMILWKESLLANRTQTET